MHKIAIIYSFMILLSACYRSKADRTTDESTDSASEIDTDDAMDTVSESDSQFDSESDSAPDSDSDADGDSESGTEPQSDSDTDTDSESETAIDSETGEGTETSTEPYVLQSCEGEVVFPAPGLERAVRKSVNQYIFEEQYNTSYTGELTGELLADLDTLTFTMGENISSLGGIECLKNVETVHLGDNRISDISLLSSLTSIQSLILEINEIADIEPLRGLTRLNHLTLSNNPISNMAPLAGLTGIEILEINNTGVSSLDWMSNMTDIIFLSASGNTISDISPLSIMEGLKTFDLSSNEISDLSPLSGFTDLIIVDLSQNHIADLTPIAGATFFSLYLSNNEIVDISPLANISKDDPNNAVYELKLDGNQIEDISVLANFTDTYGITLWDNRIQDLKPLLTTRFSQELDNYDFSKNQIEDLTPLASFGYFSSLDISDNLVSDLRPLSGKGISILKAAHNAIHELTPLIGVMRSGSLGELDLTDNRVVSAMPLTSMARVFSEMPNWISLLGNPLDEMALENEIPDLCADESTEIYFGNGETCSWNTAPSVEITAFDPAPAPYDEVDEIDDETCDAAPLWLLSGALPSVAHHGADFTIDDTVAAEPLMNDMLTGLSWRRCSEGQIAQTDACSGDASALTMADAVAACSGTFGGYDDWRLATLSELMSLIDYSVSYPGPTIDAVAFPDTYTGGYWSSTALPKTSGVVGWRVNFYNGTTDIAEADDTSRARCVRGAVGSPDAERFETVEETVIDTWTGLEWRRCAEGQTFDGTRCVGVGTAMSSDSASTACAAAFAGQSDWRLPTVSELQSIVSRCGADPASHTAFLDIPRVSFWSDTPLPGADPKQWRVDFGFGWTEPGALTDVAQVRCLR